MPVLLRELGPYQIIRCMATSGMADVYLARHTNSDVDVVLKVPRTDDPGMRESERRGAVLQSLLADADSRVPRVLDMDEDAGLFFVVMEYVKGEDLTERIARGPLAWPAAAGIAREVLDVLSVAHGLPVSCDGVELHGIVHGDIKPRNVRLQPEGGLKVLDFGIAKALSLSRRVTRNEFGSLPYSSPERIDTGQVDASADLWAVGVVLYEMLTGSLPYEAENTRRLEQKILSRTPPAPPDVPASLAAILRKALAPLAGERYATAAAMRDDLDALLRGEEPLAVSQPIGTLSEATRRTTPVEQQPHEETRRTLAEPGGETTRRTGASDMPTPALPSRRPKRTASRTRRIFTLAAGGALALLALSEVRVWNRARDLRRDLATSRRADADALWTRWVDLSEGQGLRVGTVLVREAFRDWLVSCADGLTANYLSDVPTIREGGWLEATKLLRHALALAPRDDEVRARLLYGEGQLHRINGQARIERAPNEARAEFHEAIGAFREAARLRPGWPDPYLGLARTFIYGLDDLDHGIESLTKAEEAGYRLGSRETAQLADGYRKRASRLWAQAGGVRGLPQEGGFLDKVEEDCLRALGYYESIPAYGDSGRQIRATQGLLEQATARREELRAEEGWWSRFKRSIQ